MEEEIIQKFKDLILDEHYCEDCNELCGIGEAFPLEFVAKYIIKLEKENKLLKKVNDIVEKIDTEEVVLKIEDDIEKLIEELTKVRPEMLNDEALKLFNTIMAILDERDRWRKKIKEIRDKAEVMDYYTLPDVIDDLNKLLGEELIED